LQGFPVKNRFKPLARASALVMISVTADAPPYGLVKRR
jgi:hypothetical protein